MSEPPSLKELADQVEISLKNLMALNKFMEILFRFLYDYKMNVASNMLSSKITM